MILFDLVKLRLGKESLLKTTTKISLFVWLFCLASVFAIIGYVVGIRGKLFYQVPIIFTFVLFGLILLGFLAFLIGSVSFTVQQVSKGKRENKIIFFFKILVSFAVLPLFLLTRVIEPLKIIKKFRDGELRDYKKFNFRLVATKILAVFGVLIVILPIWTGGYLAMWGMTASKLGYISQDMPIVGTGSMYPTWPKGTKGKSDKELTKEIVSTAGFLPYPNGIVVGGKRYFGHTLERGDIITWTNDSTRKLTSAGGAQPAGLLKRLIGLPEDKIELRDGVLYLNGRPQKEPYIAKPHSTFGENFLHECQTVTVPKDSVFAMGDNRKGSGDSREIGFASIKDIDKVIPLSDQKGRLDKNWHDTTHDLDSSSKPKIDRKTFMELLNKLRKDNGAGELKYDLLLQRSAELRGEEILRNNDFKQEKYTMEQSMADAGYWNPLWWEVPIEGYYEADELIDDYLERGNPEAKKNWFDKRFNDIGIAEVQGSLNDCPTQVMVIQVAGYIPATYQQSTIGSWGKALSNLKEILPSWEKIKDYHLTYYSNQRDADRLLQIFNRRIAMIQRIVNKMKNGQWLNSEETNYMSNEDQALYNESMVLTKKLNDIRWQL